MPYKDIEKRREARRNADRKRAHKVGEVWCIIVYPESAPDDWRETLQLLCLQIVVSPLHDKDLNPDGELKKPHYHVAIHYESKKSFEQVKELADELNSPIPMKQDSWRGICRYCCHLDNPEKAQYPVEDVVCYGGADYLSIIAMSNDKYEIIGGLLGWINANPHVHKYAFNRVLDWCQENNEEWYRGLCDNCSWVIIEYLKSAKWDSIENAQDGDSSVYVCRECGLVGDESQFTVMFKESDSKRTGICNTCAHDGRNDIGFSFGGE